jgi:hypothetical protein
MLIDLPELLAIHQPNHLHLCVGTYPLYESKKSIDGKINGLNAFEYAYLTSVYIKKEQLISGHQIMMCLFDSDYESFLSWDTQIKVRKMNIFGTNPEIELMTTVQFLCYTLSTALFMKYNVIFGQPIFAGKMASGCCVIKFKSTEDINLTLVYCPFNLPTSHQTYLTREYALADQKPYDLAYVRGCHPQLKGWASLLTQLSAYLSNSDYQLYVSNDAITYYNKAPHVMCRNLFLNFFCELGYILFELLKGHEDQIWVDIPNLNTNLTTPRRYRITYLKEVITSIK